MNHNLQYWPENLLDQLPISPLRIFKEAAVQLGQISGGAVEASVDQLSGGTSDLAYYTFNLQARSIGLTYTLLQFRFPVTALFPVEIFSGNNASQANDEGQLRTAITTLLSSEQSIRTIRGIVAQVRDSS